MELVYNHAICNIAATIASSGEQGCFFSRNPTLVQTCRRKVDMVSMVELRGTHVDLVDLTCPSDLLVHEAPLNRRAWVLQEQYLSDRIIHCTR